MTDSMDYQSHHEPGAESTSTNESEFEHDVREFVLRKLQADDDATITCPSLTIDFLDEFSEQYGALGGWRTAAYIGVAQTIRPILRKNDEPDLPPVQPELPELSLLQKRYAVPGAGDDGESAYIPRHKLTKEQMLRVVTRFRGLSVHYARAADALESWWHREHGSES